MKLFDFEDPHNPGSEGENIEVGCGVWFVIVIIFIILVFFLNKCV